MIFRQLSATNDWLWGQGVGGYATGNQAIGLNIQTRIQSWVGNCFFSANDFIDWLSLLDVGQEQNLVLAIKLCILQSFGVVSLSSFSYTLNARTRKFSFTANIQTIYSQSYQVQMSLQSGQPQGAS